MGVIIKIFQAQSSGLWKIGIFDILIIMSYSNFYARFYTASQRWGSALAATWRLTSSRWYLLAFLVFQLIAWWQTIFIFRSLTGDFLVLHYNISLGVDLVGEPQRIFLYPIFGLIIALINFFILLILQFHKNFLIFANLLLGSAVFFNFLLNLALFSIYLVNFR